eukprot:GSChrysophyteH1.ASY1.ANO1.2360.1 assembled CDS
MDPQVSEDTSVNTPEDDGMGLSYFIETYGCQMNVSDSEIVRSVMQKEGHTAAKSAESADLVLINTCAIRENAEAKIWNRLAYLQSVRRDNKAKPQNATFFPKQANKKSRKTKPYVGVLGCMAERLKERLLDEDSVDFVVGPDAYRDIPRLVDVVTNTGQKEANTQLSLEETYADIAPVRESDNCSAFVSIMRGCNNMCSYCVVPFTRGRERSRHMSTILSETAQLISEGVQEVCLLGQNVNTYHDLSEKSALAPGARFSNLLEAVSDLSPELRIRFTSPHPKDFPFELLSVIASRDNLCKSLHMPAQSGSTEVLKRMRRGYSRESYIELVERAREMIPGVTISTDMITGFCGETEEEHQETLSLMELIGYDQAFMFAYSERGRTHAAHKLKDDVPEEVKIRRLQEVIEVYRRKLKAKNSREETFQQRLVLIEGPASRSTPELPLLTGRTDGNKRVVFPAANTILTSTASIHMETVIDLLKNSGPRLQAQIDAQLEKEIEVAIAKEAAERKNGNIRAPSLPKSQGRMMKTGDYVIVFISEAEGPTLRGTAFAKSTMKEFHDYRM